MKKILFILGFCIVAVTIFSQELKSPNQQFCLNFNLDENGAPIYSLSYKGKKVINPSKLGLELMGYESAEFGTEIEKKKDPKTSLYDGLILLI